MTPNASLNTNKTLQKGKLITRFAVTQRSDLLVGRAEERGLLEVEVSLEEEPLLVDCWGFFCSQVNGSRAIAVVVLDIVAMRGEDG